MDYSVIYNRFGKGDSVFIPGNSGEPRAFVEALATAPEIPEISITHTFIPGINTAPLATHQNNMLEIAFFPRSGERLNSDHILFKRDSWMGVCRYLQQQQFDWVVLQVSPPNKDGQCSLGTSVEFLPLLLERSHKLIGIINQQVPFVSNAPAIKFDDLDCSIECDEPLVSVSSPEPDDASKKIAKYLTTLIDRDSILQTGIGNIPDIFLSSLKQHTGLKFKSGMLSDGFLDLYDAGALAPDFDHSCTLCLGSNNFYQRLPEVENLSLVPVEISHAQPPENTNEAFVAINSALQVDCLGRANLEFIGERRISNVGGALDFAQRANRGKRSLNVVAMPATAGNGKYSRIVAQLSSQEHDSLAGTSIDRVVTEYGIADLSGRTGTQRAEAMIEIAAPTFRPELEKAL